MHHLHKNWMEASELIGIIHQTDLAGIYRTGIQPPNSTHPPQRQMEAFPNRPHPGTQNKSSQVLKHWNLSVCTVWPQWINAWKPAKKSLINTKKKKSLITERWVGQRRNQEKKFKNILKLNESTICYTVGNIESGAVPLNLMYRVPSITVP